MDNKHHTREAEIEARFIEQLIGLGYKYRSDIKDKHSLEANFREHFNRLNDVVLTDAEFKRLKEQIITQDVFAASKELRVTDVFMRENDIPLYYTLVNIEDWCKNEFEVVNQLRINTENSFHRYDVIILINGLPVVQVELKEYETNPKRAMEQIVKYKNDIGNGYTNSLLCFIQLFIVSNEVKTFYFANNREEFFEFDENERFLPVYTYADANNEKINKLSEFAKNFLAKCTLADIISKYMVLVETEKRILVMRPYQIYAVKAILKCIEDNRGNGYIWHTTGSGKTLTSFKASTLLKADKSIDKCLFVVDRKDLDSQTRDEFNKFQENCVEENTNIESLVKRLLSEDIKDKIIVTTIQKLGLALNSKSKQNLKRIEDGKEVYGKVLEPIQNKRFAIIFDECHRSQFGDYHDSIKTFFPKSQLFGFTGTPIFEKNSVQKYVSKENERQYYTTLDVFEKELHKYTITNAIDDKNVLRFHVDYYDKTESPNVDKATEKVIKHKKAEAILNKHNGLTQDKRFNALFATASINDAIEYYNIFKEKISEHKEYSNMNIACIFSPPAEGNKDIEQMQEDLEQEREDNKVNQSEKKAALTKIINDYNKKYSTNFDINRFDEYYRNLQKRIKDQQYPNEEYSHNNKIDITIVVDMLLTGFDSKYLNTLYVDKNLKYHNLIQAFSRTNRILNSTKPHGNIVDFRNQHNEVDEAVALFSGLDNVEKSKEIWIVEDYSIVKEKYIDAVNKLKKLFDDSGIKFEASEVYNLHGDTARSDFIECFKEVQKIKTTLDQYVEVDANEKEMLNNILPEKELEKFRGAYLDIAQTLKEIQNNNNADGTISEEEYAKLENIDFEYVLFSSALIDYDYIMALISQYTSMKSSEKEYVTQKELIKSLLRSTSNLIDESKDIIDYVETLKIGEPLTKEQIEEGYKQYKQIKINEEIEKIAKEFQLKYHDVKDFVDNIIRRMRIDSDELTELFEDRDLDWKESGALEDKFMQRLIPVINKLANGNTIRGLEVYDNNQ